MRHASATMSAPAFRAAVTSAARLGVDLSAALSAVDIDVDSLRSGDRVPLSVARRVMSEVFTITKDPDVGLRMSEVVDPTTLGVLWYLMRNAATLREGLLSLSEYPRLMTDVEDYRFHERDGICYITLAFDSPSAMGVRMFAQIRLVFIVRFARELCGRSVTPREVDFPFSPPADTHVFRRTLGVQPRFCCRRARIAFDSADLDVALPGADAELHALMKDHADRLVAELPVERALAQRVRRELCIELQGGVPTIQHVAASLGLSSRTLQRRLGEEGASFQEILEEERRTLALRYLEDKGMTVSEIAFLLGFSSASSFNNAFRRWAGVTPGQHRRESPAPM